MDLDDDLDMQSENQRGFPRGVNATLAEVERLPAIKGNARLATRLN
jgi:hypothetical protein